MLLQNKQVFLLQAKDVNAREHAWIKHISAESPGFLVAASVTLGVQCENVIQVDN